MAAGTLKSAQETNRTAAIPVMKEPNEMGTVTRLYFNHTVVAGDLDAGTTINLVYIPANCRIYGGIFACDAGYADTNATLAIGDGITAARFLAAGAIAGVGEYAFGNTIALGFGDKITTGFILKATTATAALLALGVSRGYVDIVID
jgi:hypothetical protein